MNNLLQEQSICIACGFCCDGNLFTEAVLQPGEQATLPEKMKQKFFTSEKGAFFRLPCPYFRKKCSIYHSPKAQVCSSFRCRLLVDMEKLHITPADALKIIGNARTMLEEIYMLALPLLNVSETLYFTAIQGKLWCMEPEVKDTPQMKILVARCTILEALFIRHFKPESEFAAMKAPAMSVIPATEP